MWCAACQQDVPGVAASAGEAAVCCARCGKTLAEGPARAKSKVPFEDLPEFVELEDWEFAETIEQAARRVHNIAHDLQVGPQRRQRRDTPHSLRSPASSRLSSRTRAGSKDQPNRSTNSTPWLVLALGLGVFVCGAALIAISLVSERPQLWQMGLPMVLGGQVAILAVVASQLDSVWNSNRATFVALHAMDEQVRQLREEWEDLKRQDIDQPFYQHLAEGASPEVLLGDLKDQIDVLSEHLTRNKRAA
jgi:hypothetical protein